MKSYRRDGKIILEIPEKDFLGPKFVGGNVKIVDKEKFLDYIANNLAKWDSDYVGETDIQAVLDDIIFEAFEKEIGTKFKGRI